ncbi:unnamed protein product [Anisakis simplex]|uniref:Col_cuticle_N domain-containing protein n=1 Tax=Anisakis simplex TaxID=6269 RepID=A0A0M3J3I8_ANISI|nr:unnamed protein product [Anisakis simplex]
MRLFILPREDYAKRRYLTSDANGRHPFQMEDKITLFERQREAETLRKYAFCGVALSAMATMFCVMLVPMLYNYMQHMQAIMQNEVDFCRSRSANIWREVTRTQVGYCLLLWQFFNGKMSRFLSNV